MNGLAELVASQEDWLMRRVLQYAKEHEYTKYTSTLAEAWRTSIAGLSEALIQGLQAYRDPPEFHPDEDFSKDPIASFGILEAQRHRARGVSLSMFLGLMKYYRQSYIDLVLESGFDRDIEEQSRLYVDRFFDRVELGLAAEWVERSQSDLVGELQSANRLMTNEKNKYLTIFESLGNPVITLNGQNATENMNHAALVLFSDHQTPGAYYYDHERKIEPIQWLSEELADFNGQTEPDLAFEKELHFPEYKKHFEVKLTRMLDVSGKFSGTIVVLNDITDRKRAQEALRESEAQKQAILDGITANIAFVNEDLEILWVNKTASNSVGKLPSQMMGRKCHEFWAEPEKPCDGCPTVRAFETKKSEHTTMVTPDGRVWDEKGEPVLDVQGRLMGVVEIAQDITDRVRAEKEKENLTAQLVQAQKMEAVGTLTAGIAHDFNNLLTVILGYSELLLAGRDEKDPVSEDLQKILLTARHGAELVQRLLALSTKSETEAVRLDLNRQVTATAKLLSRTLPKMIRVQMLLADNLGDVHADPAQVDQMLMNLAINAKEAMPDGGTLTLKTTNVTLENEFCSRHPEVVPGEYVLLSVSDTGRGMDKQIQERMFDPFFTTKGWDYRKGTGLGLPIVYRLVQHHGGCVECFSEVGKGTTMNVYLPRLATEPLPDRRGSKDAQLQGNETILLVDDEDLVRALGERILTKAGYRVLTAPNGREALEVYEKNRSEIALVILDLIMPEMGGKECLRELIRIDHQVRIVVSSGHTDSADLVQTPRECVWGSVRKPYGVGQLLETVRKALDASPNR